MPHATNGSTVDNDEEIDYSDIEAKYQVSFEDGFDSVLVVDNLPVVGSEKKDRLISVISKNFSKKGPAPKASGIVMPWDPKSKKSKGYAFIEFETAEEANVALAVMQGYHFDKEHTLILNRFTDIEKFANMDETYVEPEPEEYKPREHLKAWLADPQGRDQYLTYRHEDVTVHWHTKPTAQEIATTRRNWTDLYMTWSPEGTYLASIHRQGVRLWGGTSWTGLLRFAHPFAQLISFSPCEKYIVTWSREPIQVPPGAPTGPTHFTEDDEGNQIAVWEIATGNLLRTFPVTQEKGLEEGAKKQMVWPALKWSYDDKYVARVTPGQQISVYELPGMGLLDKKSIKIEGVVDFEWCPVGDKDRDEEEGRAGKKAPKKERENILAYWTPEISNQPARVTLLAVPSRTILRSKNLFNVSDCKFHWQNQGDFLCVKVDRHTKTKKSIFCNLEIFRMREKDFPVEVIEIKDTVTEFAWEPRGERFGIVTSSDPNLGNPGPGITIKTEVLFYQLEKGKDFRLLTTLPNRTSNTIRWSPRGHHVVLATIGSTSKFDLEFWDLDFSMEDRKEGQQVEWGSGIKQLSPNGSDHYGLTDVEWDPSGRYVATSASAWRHQLENGFAIWDFRGQELQKHILDRFKQFLWRPRPRTLVSKEQQKQLRRTLREFSRKFDEEDAADETSANKEIVAHRRRLVDEWNAWRVKCKKEVAERKGATPLQDREGERAKEKVEEWVEEVLEVIEEVEE